MAQQRSDLPIDLESTAVEKEKSTEESDSTDKGQPASKSLGDGRRTRLSLPLSQHYSLPDEFFANVKLEDLVYREDLEEPTKKPEAPELFIFKPRPFMSSGDIVVNEHHYIGSSNVIILLK